MCGIAGFLSDDYVPGTAERETMLWRMIAPMRHRGPDDEGVWTDGSVGLAHARLSIIDVSAAGHQPMASADGAIWITYNGEIYNFADIRRELTALGYGFHSRTDTEVIVNGWHAWGPRIFSRLRGMFAFGLWDRRTRRLVLARDRFGKKPLYWARTSSGLIFGSEIKALYAWPDLRREPNLAAIDQFLTLQYVPAPMTAFAGISKLPAAHYLTIAMSEDGRLDEPELVRYWELPYPAASPARLDPTGLCQELVARLEQAVRLRLIADVPLGAFLSGGVDSSAVVAMMARAAGGPVKTFSIGFADARYDETRYARMVAQRYGTDHRELVVEPDAAAVLPRLVWHYGEPFADPSAVPTWYVSEMARREVTVALTGDGGDESFLGYGRYKAMHWLAELDRGPQAGRLALARLIGLAPAALQRRLKLPQIRAVLTSPRSSPADRYLPTIAFFGEVDKSQGYGEAMRGRNGKSAAALLASYFDGSESLLAGANRADIHTYLPDDLMVKVDVAGMAHGLEARSPLLDHELAEWAAQLPTAVRMQRGALKALFKSAMEPYLPRAVLYRRKRGFGCPIDRWFRHELKEMAYDVLLSQTARQRGLFRPDYVSRLLDEHRAHRRDHQNRLWALLMLESWFRMWVDAPIAAAVYSQSPGPPWRATAMAPS
ncbi:MAG TPA: asparagine synthase (glutamine-hydrolyzing) [Stellaceae bacterium]|nr:asparagine synthase (glutamine-hydrolyzing) [Stellaceae bacterium]